MGSDTSNVMALGPAESFSGKTLPKLGAAGDPMTGSRIVGTKSGAQCLVHETHRHVVQPLSCYGSEEKEAVSWSGVSDVVNV